ncbi:hypothetical protein [Brevibacillus borstelensis]|uniref:hypothetical protein n=1 Tax=Brevibacillus borstelensis TaxID=45462 RepID=UPI0030F504CD
MDADIDLSKAPYNTGNGWTPIGTETTPFTGTFHGNGHTIRGLYIFEGKNLGLFGTIEGKAEISDLTLKDADIRTTKSGVAILVGQMLGGTITNTHVSGTIKADSHNVGTLVGYMERGSIADSCQYRFNFPQNYRLKIPHFCRYWLFTSAGSGRKKPAFFFSLMR